jgi:hypothetical protein
MASLINEAIAGFASLVTLTIAYTVFAPIISDIMQSVVLSALANPDPNSALAINVNALLLTNNIIVMGIKVFAFFVLFAIIARIWLYVGFKNEETGVY